MDQKKACADVECSIGRDILHSDLAILEMSLDKWANDATILIENIEEKAKQATAHQEEKRRAIKDNLKSEGENLRRSGSEDNIEVGKRQSADRINKSKARR